MSLGSGVSIVIIARNSFSNLATFLESFFKTNSYSPVEIIIINSLSSESVHNIISKFCTEALIRYIKTKSNLSFSDCYNLAAKKARYSYILLLDHDIIYNNDVLPKAVAKLDKESSIGAVGIRLDDDQEGLTADTEQSIQHLGIHFIQKESEVFYNPEAIRYQSVAEFSPDTYHSPDLLALSDSFYLIRQKDFEHLKGFKDLLNPTLDVLDFCLRLKRDLGKSCYCIVNQSLQKKISKLGVLANTTTLETDQRNAYERFNHLWREYLSKVIGQKQTPTPQALPAPSFETSQYNQHVVDQETCQTTVLFILAGSLECNNGYQVQLLARLLKQHGIRSLLAVPELAPSAPIQANTEHPDGFFLTTYAALLQGSPELPPFDIIHAWTPREGVRIACEQIMERTNCPLIIHLEDNEEYLTEKIVGRPWAELASLPQAELDKLIPSNCYHPVNGPKFLKQAQSMTMVIETLSRFNVNNVPSTTLPPLVDECLFYPRPINYKLRKELGIDDGTVVLVYSGNLHAGNVDEVRELYQAVELLNEQGCTTVLLRTGSNDKGLGIEKWNTTYEKYLGWVERERVPDILAAADILIQPGKSGPFNDERIPCKLLEYFAMGRPVVLPRTNIGLKIEHMRAINVLDNAAATQIALAVQDIRQHKNTKTKTVEDICILYNNLIPFKRSTRTFSFQHTYYHYSNTRNGISLVTCCRNREYYLLQSIQTWLNHSQIQEIVIVDWNSDTPLEQTLKTRNINDSRIVIVRVENEPNWVLSHAYNLGFRLAQFNKILKVDSDILIHDNFFEKNNLQENVFIAGNCALQPKKNSHINGFFFVSRDALLQVNGFNENLTFYGWEDDDLYNRLQTFGLKRHDLAADTITHLEHEDTLRLAFSKIPSTTTRSPHLEKDPDFLIRANRELSLLLPPWWNTKQMSNFHLAHINPNLIKAKRIEKFNNNISTIFLDYSWDYAARELLYERECIDSSIINYKDFWKAMAKPTWHDSVAAIHALYQSKTSSSEKRALSIESSNKFQTVAPPLSSSGKPGISLVTCSMNRSENLLKAIGTWLMHQEISEIVIVDWSSYVPVSEILNKQGIFDKRIRVCRVEGEPRWILSYAFNLGFRMSSYDKVLKTDADIIINKNFFSDNKLNKDEYIAGNWRNVPQDQVHVNGFFFIHRKYLSQINGFNEKITTYGWDDDDLYNRLNKLGLKRKDVAPSSIYHIHHTSQHRICGNDSQAGSKSALELVLTDPLFFTQTNRVICEKMQNWGKSSKLAQFHQLSEYENMQVFRRSPALRTQIPSSVKSNAELEALKIVAKTKLDLDIWKLNDTEVRGFLSKYYGVQEQVKSDRLGNYHSKFNNSPEIMIPRKKMFIDCQHGLGNRLRAIGSAAAIAEKTDRELVIIWEPDHHCECRLADLFDYSGAIIDKSFIQDALQQKCKVYNYMEHEEGAVKDVPIDLSWDGDIYTRSNCVLKAPPSTWEAENRFLRSLTPVQTVRELVAGVRTPNDVSAHVRMVGGTDYEHMAYEATDNWTKDGHMKVDFWRRKSHFKHFIARIDTLIAKGRADRIFLAADKPETYEAFLSTFGDRIAYLKRDVYDRSVEQLRYALADVILLGSSPLLLGSTWSSFSELAMRLSTQKMQIEMSGKDF